MIDYDTMAEAIFRERALHAAMSRVHQREPGQLPATPKTRQRVAGLLLSLATWLAPAAPTPTVTKQRAS